MTSAINDFMINTVLINPIKDIVLKLENREFRDCDIKWLNQKLENFTKFACETLGKKIESGLQNESFPFMNENVRVKYLGYFNTLLNYFKTF